MNNIRSNPGGVLVGQRIDEDALEGKNPQVKEMKELELSLNGGLDDADDYQHDPLGNQDNMSDQDTPPDVDIGIGNRNKVVDNQKANKSYNANFPQDKFM